jgi:hypothetical protein
MWLRAGRLRDRRSIPSKSEKIFPLASVSRPALGPIQPSVQWVSRVKRGRCVTLTTHPHLVSRSWMSTSYSSSPPSVFVAFSGTALALTHLEIGRLLGVRSVSIITLMMEAERTSETSVYFKETTWCYIPESCHLSDLGCVKAMAHTEFCHRNWGTSQDTSVNVALLITSERDLHPSYWPANQELNFLGDVHAGSCNSQRKLEPRTHSGNCM